MPQTLPAFLIICDRTLIGTYTDKSNDATVGLLTGLDIFTIMLLERLFANINTFIAKCVDGSVELKVENKAFKLNGNTQKMITKYNKELNEKVNSQELSESKYGSNQASDEAEQGSSSSYHV